MKTFCVFAVLCGGKNLISLVDLLLAVMLTRIDHTSFLFLNRAVILCEWNEADGFTDSQSHRFTNCKSDGSANGKPNGFTDGKSDRFTISKPNRITDGKSNGFTDDKSDRITISKPIHISDLKSIRSRSTAWCCVH